ncbi:hypothetical protein [Roseateles sp. BYS87W]|uniref:DUF1566 domain-containing protein n=1 Tax=Pelomonas baiyunensis TaxID=3299026 RepID=A0ABW7H0F3_9BURK
MAMTIKRWARTAALALLMLLVAWVACNGPWADDSPQPVPPALRLSPPGVPPELNAFVGLQGLLAPDGADLQAAGLAALRGDAAPSAGPRLRWPEGPLWQCQARRDDCVARWRAQPEAARALLADTQLLGARCERLAQAQAWEELLPERQTEGPRAGVPFAALPVPQFVDLTACVRRFGLKAVMAPSAAAAEAELVQADRLARLALAGSRSLIGTMVTLSVVQSNWLLAADLKAAGGLDRGGLMRLLTPLPAVALSPRAWAPHEARFAREVTRDLMDEARDCGAADALMGASATGLLDRLVCTLRLGVLPEATIQHNEAQWLARLATVPEAGPAACEVLEAEPWRERESRGFAWRNTVGRWLLDTSGAGWSPYAARQLDLELLRLTLGAQLLGQSPPAGVSLTRESAGQRFAACRARLHPGDAEATLRLPLL